MHRSKRRARPAPCSHTPHRQTPAACTARVAGGGWRPAAPPATAVDASAPEVTRPAAITVAAAEVDGARGTVAAAAASDRVGASLAGGTPVDLRDAAPVRMVP